MMERGNAEEDVYAKRICFKCMAEGYLSRKILELGVYPAEKERESVVGQHEAKSISCSPCSGCGGQVNKVTSRK